MRAENRKLVVNFPNSKLRLDNYAIGDKVRKKTIKPKEAEFIGEIKAKFTSSYTGLTQYVVEDVSGLMRIYRPINIEPIE